MGNWLICNEVTGNPEQILSVNNKSDFEEAGWYKGTGKPAVDLPSSFDESDVMNKSYWDMDESALKERGVKPTQYYTWTAAKKWEVDNTMLMRVIRLDRNSLLLRSDWTQLVDSPLTDSKKAEWVTYRQTLRDITKDLPEDLDAPEGLSWPSEPS